MRSDSGAGTRADRFPLAAQSVSVVRRRFGRVEGAGIDFILPYWMGRYYGLNFAPLAVSAASGGTTIAPDSIASLLGSGLPATGAQVSVVDSAGVTRRSNAIFFSSSDQINFLGALRVSRRGRRTSTFTMLTEY